MAVYQISKIQIRRGKVKSGPGFPQLSSGELGWAIDSQELYIGNGSISEGAPSVGNTKILTDGDISGDSGLISLLEYTYRSQDTTISTGSDPGTPVARLLQAVLDDTVYTSSFGTIGDGTIDDTEALQRAITQLFSNSILKAYLNTQEGVKKRVILRIPAGIFLISNSLVIPSFATVIGAGIDKTIIRYTGLANAIRFSSDFGSSYNITTPRFVNIEGITIESPELGTTCLDATNLSDSTFRNIKLVGGWLGNISIYNKGIVIANASNVSFNNIIVNNFYYGIVIDNEASTIEINTGSIFSASYGITAGVDLNSSDVGVSNLYISNIKFNQISRNGVLGGVGSSNFITNCSFTNVGGDNDLPIVPQIYFANPNFSCSEIKSDRTTGLSNISSAARYMPEVSGSGIFSSTVFTADLTQSLLSSNVIRLPLRTDSNGTISGPISYDVNYLFNGTVDRIGTLSIVVSGSSIIYSDDYTFDSTVGNGSSLQFTVAKVNNTILISYVNGLSNGKLTYSYTSKF